MPTSASASPSAPPTWHAAIDEVKRKADLPSMLAAAGVRLKPNGARGHHVASCPRHQDQTPSLHVYPDHVHCFSCGWHADVIDVYAEHHALPLGDAIAAMAREHGVALPVVTREWLAAEEKRRETSRLLGDLAEQARVWLWDEQVGGAALAYLRGRGLADETIRSAALGYWPKGQSSKALADEGGGAVATEDRKPYTFQQLRDVGFRAVSEKDGRRIEYDVFFEQVVFPVHVHGRLVYLTGRSVPRDDGEGGGRKRHAKLAGQPAPALYGLHGLPRDPREVVICEGEIDTLTLQQAGIAAVGLLGASSHLDEAADMLRRLGVDRVILMLDADEAGERATRELGMRLGSRARVVRPDYPEDCKDPNDLLRGYLHAATTSGRGSDGEEERNAREIAAARIQAFYAPLIAQAPSFLDWMLAGLEVESDQAVQGRRLQEEVIPFLAGVEEIERAAMIDKVANTYRWIRRPQVEREVRAELKRRAPSKEDKPGGEGLSALLADRLVGPGGPFLPLYLDRAGKDGTIVTLYSQRHGAPVSLYLCQPRQVMSALAPELGDVELWTQTHVPSIDPQRVTSAITRAVSRVAADLRPRWDLQEVADGMHLLGPKDRRVVALVDSRLRLVRDREAGAWSKPASPIIDDRYLLTSRQRVHGWLPAEWSIERVNEPLKYTPREAYDLVFDLVREGWRFRDHESGVDPFIVASLPFALVWSQAFPTKSLIHLTAQTNSGKSLLIQGLYAGKDQRLALGMLPTAYYNPDPSSAGIIGAFSGSSRTIILDEFEQSEERQQGRFESILRMMRTAATGSSARLRGTQDQGAREDSLSLACIAASIEPIGSKDADRNRWFKVELAHSDSLDGPELAVPRWMRARKVDVDELRRTIVFGLADRVDELRDAYLDIQRDQDLPGRGAIDDRWLCNVWPCLAVAKVLGYDYRKMHGKIVEAKTVDFRGVKENRKGNRLLDTLMFSSFEHHVEIMGGGTRRETTTLAVQADAYLDKRDWSRRLEFPWLGVFIQVRGDDLLMWVHPETVVRGPLLRSSREFAGLDPGGFVALSKDSDRWLANSAVLWCDLNGGDGGGPKKTRRTSLFRLRTDSATAGAG